MLIGSGYDAYCVNGYGSQDLCQMDLTREVCPLTIKPRQVWPHSRLQPPVLVGVTPLHLEVHSEPFW